MLARLLTPVLVIGVMSAGFAGPAYAVDGDDAGQQTQQVAPSSGAGGGDGESSQAGDGEDAANQADDSNADDGTDGDAAGKSASDGDGSDASESDGDSSGANESDGNGNDAGADQPKSSKGDSTDGGAASDDSGATTQGDGSNQSGSDGNDESDQSESDDGSDGSDDGSASSGAQPPAPEVEQQSRSLKTMSTDSRTLLKVVAEVDGDPVSSADASHWKYTAQGQYRSTYGYGGSWWDSFTSSNSPFTLSSGNTHEMDTSYRHQRTTYSGDDIRYQVIEDSIPDGYESDGSTCTGSGNSTGTGWSDGVTPNSGNTVTCTFSYKTLDPATVVVKVGGDRDGDSSHVNGLAGAKLGLFTNRGDSSPVNNSWAVCTSDANGDCTFEVPASELSYGGYYNNSPQTSFWVKQISTASGYFVNTELAYGSSVSNTPYRFETPKLDSGETYTSGHDFMRDYSSDNRTSGTWQNSRNNPGTSQMCGIDLALILDTSGSIANSGSTQDQIDAANGVVDALKGTHSKVGVYSFASGTNDSKSATSVSTNSGAQSVKDFINSDNDINHPNGATNWDEGIAQVLGSHTTYDVAVIVTDGNPTTERGGDHGSGSRTDFAEVEGGIFSANAVKALGTQMVAIGVGDGVSGDSVTNLKAISGPHDYYSFDDFDDAAATIKDLALGACSGSVTITKNVMDRGNDDISQSSAAGGWDFSAASNTNGVSLSKTSGTTESDGTVNFPVNFAGGVEDGTVTFTETQQDGYRIFPVNGKNAVCTNNSTGDPLTVTNASSGPGFSVDVGSSAAVTCQVYNQENPSVTLNKQWKNAADGDSATLTVGNSSGDSTASGSHVTSSGITHLDKNVASESFAEGETVTIGEQLGDNPGSYGDPQVTCTDGVTPTDNNDGTYSFEMPSDNVTCTFTNQNKKQNVTLQKKWVDAVSGDTAKLTINGGHAKTSHASDAGTDGIDATHTTDADVYVGVPVTVSESLGGSNTGAYGSSVTCTAPGDWSSDSDGTSDTFTMPNGDVTCTITNSAQSKTLTVVKKWVNASDGDTVTIDVNGDELFSPKASDDDSADQSVAVGADVTITESQSDDNDANYTVSGATCTGADATWKKGKLTFTMPNDDVTCTITNTADTSKVTFIKTWENGVEGDSTKLVISGSVDGEGGTNTSTVGDDRSFTDTLHPAIAKVTQGSTIELVEYFDNVDNVGNYSLAMSCDAGVELSQGYTFTMPKSDVTCEVTNTLVSGTLTLVKDVDNVNGGDAKPSDWDLTGTLDGDSFSVSGTASDSNGVAVDGAVVPAGTYTISESDGPDGYKLSDLTCYVNNDELKLDGDTLNVTEGQDYRCVLTNTAQSAHLTLVKELDESYGGTAAATDWTLTATPSDAEIDTISGASGDASVTDVATSAGTYTLSESGGPAGYIQTSLVCDGTDAFDGDSLTLANGDDVTCTFTNSDQPAHLTLIKNVDNANGGDATATDWTLSATLGATTVEGVSGSDEVTNVSVSGGTYTLGESDGPFGYDWTALTCSTNTDDLTLDPDTPTVQIAPGDDVTCTFTNSSIAPKLTVVKTWVDATDGDSATITVNDDDSFEPVASDESSYDYTMKIGEGVSVSESFTADNAASYSSQATCTGSDAGDDWSSDGLDFTMPNGDVTCTITNTANASTVTFEKTWVNAVEGDEAQLTIGSPEDPAGEATSTVGEERSFTDSDNAATADATQGSTVSLGEVLDGDNVGDYTAAYTCSIGDGAVEVTSDHTFTMPKSDVTCEVTNTLKSGELTLIKKVDNRNGGDAVPSDWKLTGSLDGTDFAVAHTASDANHGIAVDDAIVPVGTYSLSESPNIPGYDLTDLTCTVQGDALPGTGLGEGQSSEVHVGEGQSVTCTFTNTAQKAQLTLIKEVEPGYASSANWTLSATNGNDSLSGASGDEDVTNAEVNAGESFSLSESANDDFAGADEFKSGKWTCSGDDGDISLENSERGSATLPALAPGDDVTCEITNTWKRPDQLTDFSKTVTDGPTWDADTGDWMVEYTITYTNKSQVVGVDYSLKDTLAFADGVSVNSTEATLNGSAIDWNGGHLGIHTVAPGATDTYVVTVHADTTGMTLGEEGETQPVCDGPNTGFYNTADFGAGMVPRLAAQDDEPATVLGEPGSDSACADVPTTTFEHSKTVDSTTQNGDGTWNIVYTIDVDNTGDNPGAYSLDDTLRYGDGFTVGQASWSLNGDAETGTWADPNADAATDLATNRHLEAGGRDVYTVTVENVDVPAWALADGETTVCPTDDPEADGAFNNTSGLTVYGDTTTTNACDEPNGSTPDKAFVSAVQSPTSPESWTVTYAVTVTNNGDHANHYSLTDEPGFADGVTINGVTVDGAEQGAPFDSIQLSGTVEPNDPVVHTFVFDVTIDGTVEADQCTGEPGSGFFNAATLTVGNDEQAVTACGDVAEQVGPTVTKTVDDTTRNADGSWTTTYDVTVTQPDAESDANPEGLSGRYSLSDTLEFGDGITITDASYTDAQTGDAHDWGATDQAQELASDRVIAAGDTHTYTVTVTATITQAAVDGGTVMCRPDTDAASGFLNTAVLSTATSSDQHVEACAQPTIPIASLSMATNTICEAGVPALSYEVKPVTVLDTTRVALIWWPQGAFDDRDPSIDLSDEDALLADGAVAVDYVTTPGDWQSGEAISDTVLWPGSAIGDDGTGAGWPGFTQDADGNWVTDADAASYLVRDGAVLEARTVNASVSLDVAHPGTDCVPPLPLVVTGGPGPKAPAGPTPQSPTPQPVPLVITGGELPFTGSNALWLISFGGLLIVFGAGLTTVVAIRRRRRSDPTSS